MRNIRRNILKSNGKERRGNIMSATKQTISDGQKALQCFLKIQEIVKRNPIDYKNEEKLRKQMGDKYYEKQ